MVFKMFLPKKELITEEVKGAVKRLVYKRDCCYITRETFGRCNRVDLLLLIFALAAVINDISSLSTISHPAKEEIKIVCARVLYNEFCINTCLSVVGIIGSGVTCKCLTLMKSLVRS